MTLRAVELFSGIGGFSAAVIGCDVQVKAALDQDPEALSCYRLNFPEHPVRRVNLERISAWELTAMDADLWWLSPPCQPYCERGARRDVDDYRAKSFMHLMGILARIPEEKLPQCLALENVAGFVSSQAHGRIIDLLTGRGYHLRERLLCPTELGVPSRRPRYYLTASRSPLAPEKPLTRLPCKPLAWYLDPLLIETAPDELLVPEESIDRFGRGLRILDPDDPSAVTTCFTSGYGRSLSNAGSYLRCGSRVRRFMPDEIISLLHFPEGFRFPRGMALRRKWGLAGNSLSVFAVREVLTAFPGLNMSVPMKLLLALMLALLLSGLSPDASHAASTLLLGDAPSYPLAGHLEQLVDPSGRLTLADLLAPATAARFAPIPGAMNRGYTRDTVWLRFRMERTDGFPEDAYLCLGPQYLDTVEVYIQNGANPDDPAVYRQTLVGDHVPPSSKSVRSTDYVIPLALPPEQPCTVYLKVQSTSTVMLVGAVYTPSAVISYNNLSILLNSGYLATALVIVQINLLFYLRLRDRLYLFFAIYILFLFVNYISSAGILPLLLPDQTHLMSDYLTGCGFGLAVCAFALFAIRLFQLSAGTWTHRYFLGIFTLGVLTIVSVPLDCYGPVVSVMLIGLLVTITLLTWLSIRAVRNKEPGGILYLTAFGLSNIGYVVQFLRLLGLIPPQWWNLYAVQIASLCNMVLMTLALTERVYAAEQKALVAARYAEISAVELAEGMTVELREKQQKLEETLEGQTRFLEMISHEYRTPLAIATVNLGIIEQRGAPEGLVAEPLRKLGRAVKRMAEVFDLVLERTRHDVDVTRIDRRPVNLGEFAASLVRMARELRPDRVIDFRSAELPTIMVDQPLLGTALLNLLDNAAKFSPEESVISLELGAVADGMVIEVRDLGPGFRPEERERIFDKYQRGSASSGTSGAGVGLWLVREIVTAHGGSVTVSDNYPHGAVVTIWLPVGTENTNGR